LRNSSARNQLKHDHISRCVVSCVAMKLAAVDDEVGVDESPDVIWLVM
jgi:hypothetical protein